MRTQRLIVFLFAALVLPSLGSAQVYRHETAPPAVTAERSNWQLSGEPLFYAGSFYDPAGPDVFFDGRIMVRTGTHDGVPLYQDVTLEPYSIVYVPVRGTILRPYERRREGPLSGTVGSRLSSHPVQRVPASVDRVAPSMVEAVGTTGNEIWVRIGRDSFERLLQGRPADATMESFAPEPDATEAGAAESIPGPRSNDGVWIAFEGQQWFAQGPAVAYDALRFEQTGMYHDSPVYRDRGSRSDRIFVALSPGGPLTLFTRR